MPNSTTFPNGISGVADQVHNLGLKIGIYSSQYTSLSLLRYRLMMNQVPV